ncbi:hypothetical protein DIPPA_08229 [Diplonema papillatum]|nr:hypothetical protein DIPPA_08229 [Diplonema papillatum]
MSQTSYSGWKLNGAQPCVASRSTRSRASSSVWSGTQGWAPFNFHPLQEKPIVNTCHARTGHAL